MTGFRPLMMALALAACPMTMLIAASARAQTEAPDPVRDATREKLAALLQIEGPKIGAVFRQSTKNPYNYIATVTNGLHNSDSLEIVVSVTKSDTLGFRIYPHYKGGYINLGRVKDNVDFAHRLLFYTDQNFLFWGVDSTNDTFSGYTMTLESGFPDAAIDVVIRSILNTDKFVGAMRPAIDGSAAQ